MRAVIGLGNPEEEYARSRHNLGFLVVDALAAHFGATLVPLPAIEGKGCAVELESGLLLVQPQTGMNSGTTVAAVEREYGLKLEDILIVYDDVSMPMGRMRFQFNGGAGGHHGIEYAVASLGNRTTFNRLKVAVGPDPGGDKRKAFVLAPVEAESSEHYQRVVAAAAQAVLVWAQSDVNAAMRQFNGKAVQ